MQTVQLREAKSRLSALVEEATRGGKTIITRHGRPSAVILGMEEWNRLRTVPSFGQLLCSSGLEDDDIPPRDTRPKRELEH